MDRLRQAILPIYTTAAMTAVQTVSLKTKRITGLATTIFFSKFLRDFSRQESEKVGRDRRKSEGIGKNSI